MARTKCPTGYKWNKKQSVCEGKYYSGTACPSGMVLEHGRCVQRHHMRRLVIKPIQALPKSPSRWSSGVTIPQNSIIEIDGNDLNRGRDWIEIEERINGEVVEINRDDVFSKTMAE